jgi:DNA-binding MarR family transcriptional regulator
MRHALTEAGITDLPRHGAFILAGVDGAGGPRTDLPRELGVTKQAVSNAIESLVVGGYVERGSDPDDRRRLTLELTERGQAAVDAVRRGVDAVDDELRRRIGADPTESMRAGLVALAQIKGDHTASGAARRRPARQMRRCFPMFSVRSLPAATEHYRALGFTVVPDADADAAADAGDAVHAFARREGAGLHLVVHDRADGAGGVAYLHVRDADALYAEWLGAGADGGLRAVETTGYGMREGAHVDPDGNVIRFGSDIGD